MLKGAFIIALLVALAGIHLYWGLGGRWPGRDEDSLKQMVIGVRTKPMPGFVACALVALGLAAAAAIVMLGQGRIRFGFHSLLVQGGYAVLILVFAARGLAAYVTPAFAYARGTPFYDLNRRYYAPLCLLIAAALLLDHPFLW